MLTEVKFDDIEYTEKQDHNGMHSSFSIEGLVNGELKVVDVTYFDLLHFMVENELNETLHEDGSSTVFASSDCFSDNPDFFIAEYFKSYFNTKI